MEIIKNDLEGLTISVYITENNKLAVRLENSKGEFIGQLFSSIETVKKTYEQLSDGEKLTDEEFSKIEKAYNELSVKFEESRVSKLLINESLLGENFKAGVLKGDLETKNVSLKAGQRINYKLNGNALIIEGFPDIIKLKNTQELKSLIN